MSINTAGMLSFYSCLFLMMFIPFCDSKNTTPLKYSLVCILYSVTEYLLPKAYTPLMISFPWWVYFVFHTLAKEGIQILAIKSILKTDWMVSVIHSCVLSVHIYSAQIIFDLLAYGLFPKLHESHLAVVLIWMASTLIMAFWYRKFNRDLSRVAENDKKYYLLIAVLADVFQYRLCVAYENTLDNTLGIFSLIVPLLITTVLKKNILEEHYSIEQGRLHTLDHMAKSELTALNQYETVLTKTRHELINHMNVIRGYSENGEKDKLNEYVSEIIKKATVDPVLEYSDNVYINTIIKYLKSIHPAMNIIVDATIGSDCPADPLDLGMIVLCLCESSFSTLPANSTACLTIRQIENMIIIAESAEDIRIKDTLTETDYSMLEEVLKKYHGSLNFNVRKPGDIAVLLTCD